MDKNNDIRDRILNKIVSPYGLALISYAFFLFSCLIPPSVYSHYMMEPDLMFLDQATILFYTVCVASFFAGVWLIGWLFPSYFVVRRLETKIAPTLFLLTPLVLGTALVAISILRLIRSVPNILVFVLTQRGGDVKDALALDVEGNFTRFPLFLIGITWWAFWRYLDLSITGWRKLFVQFSLFAALLAIVVVSTLTQLRNLLMMEICGLAIIYMAKRAANQKMSVQFVVRTGLAMATGIGLLFLATAFLRGTVDFNDQIYQLLGYTAASYNRLAAIVNGTLRYPFAGRGIYLSYFVAYNHALNSIVPAGFAMPPPEFLDLWGSEFGAVTRSGLNGGLIWSGAFGYIFSDLGWFSFLFVFGYGLLHSIVWNWIRRGMIFGIVLYPLFAYSVLTWMGTNSLLDQPLVIMLIVAIALTCYEFLFVQRNGVGLAAQSASG